MKNREKKMKIKWIEFENLETGLKIERINFLDDFTLLVGLSSAGKTQILDAIHFSLMLAFDNVTVVQSYKACLGLDINGHIYEWIYCLKKQEDVTKIALDSIDEYFFEYESLKCDNKELFIRDRNNINVLKFVDIPTPKKDVSLIYQYSDDEHFSDLINGLNNLYNIDMDSNVRKYLPKDGIDDFKVSIDMFFRKKPTSSINVFSHLPTPLKIYVTKIHFRDIFNQILEAVQYIFPEIEDIGIDEDITKNRYCVQIKVYGQKLYQGDISNGMLKSIYFITELYTASDNSLIMIDEFENGLGINCINSLSDLLIEKSTQIQFIITSHHPRIIGSIDYNNWKIIEREEKVIKNFDFNDEGYKIGGNRHDAYFKLIDKWKFEGKV